MSIEAQLKKISYIPMFLLLQATSSMQLALYKAIVEGCFDLYSYSCLRYGVHTFIFGVKVLLYRMCFRPLAP